MRTIGVLVLALALAPAAAAASPTVYFTYTPDCTFTVGVDGGGSAATLPPGVYQVFVQTVTPFADDPAAACAYPRFQLSGPGVDLSTDLSSGGETVAQFTATFVAGATYVAQDANTPSASRRAIAIGTSGSAASLAPAAAAGQSSGASATNASQAVVGSAVPAPRGVLAATVGAGAVTLTKSGKPVSILKSGRYTIVVADRSRTAGFALRQGGRRLAVTSGAFVGTTRVAITLSKGQWSYATGRGTSFFIVTG